MVVGSPGGAAGIGGAIGGKGGKGGKGGSDRGGSDSGRGGRNGDRREQKTTLENPTAKDSIVANAPVTKPAVGTEGLGQEVRRRRSRRAALPRRASVLGDITEDDISRALLGRPRGTL